MFNYLSVEEVPRIAWVGWEVGGGAGSWGFSPHCQLIHYRSQLHLTNSICAKCVKGFGASYGLKKLQ